MHMLALNNTLALLAMKSTVSLCQAKKDRHLLIYFKNFMTPFYGWGSNASRLEPLRGGSLLFTTKFPEIPGTHFIDLGRMKGRVDLGATQWYAFTTNFTQM